MAFLHDRDTAADRHRTASGVGLLAGKLLLLVIAASEIVPYWMIHTPPSFEPTAQLIDAALVAGTTIGWLGLRSVSPFW